MNRFEKPTPGPVGRPSDRSFCLDARTITRHFPGIGRYTWSIAKAMVPLLEKGERLLLLRQRNQASWFDLKSLAGARVEVIDVDASPFSLRQQWLIPRLLREQGAHVYHSPYYLMPYSTVAPTVVTVFDLIPLCCPDSHTRLQRWIFSASMRLALRTATIIVTVSRSTARDLEKMLRVQPERIHVVYAGADTAATPSENDVPANLPDAYALTVSSNKPHKNLVRLVEVWARLRHHDLPLVIAGTWDRRYPHARERASALGLREFVHFLGPVAETELQGLYRKARLFVFPSHYEGFGLPVAEAMAHGIPVACANTSSLPEVAGLAASFDPTDTAAMTATIDGLLADSDRMSDLGEHGRIQAQRFTWNRAAKETLALYRALAPR